ncbi:ATP-binding SpoIIE family protein phosphatase [Streptomyces sp. NPDC052079]|uniref:ATP-binding SpoIIE family protein phosphatase n=1 Tax=Streptomyces sp. NPDC052079 TaxID=3155526 RepID=UPI0034223212
MRAIPTQRETAPRVLDARGRARVEATLSGSPLAPGSARALLRKAFTEWAQLPLPGAEQLTGRVGDDATLLASELVTNAVVHAGTEVRLTCGLEEDTGALVVEVTDHHPSRAPRGSEPEASAYDAPEYGRGLRLVAALAESWGITYRPGTKTVWARLSAGECAVSEQIEAYAGERASAHDLRVAEILAPDPLDAPLPQDPLAGHREPTGPARETWRGGSYGDDWLARRHGRDGTWLGRGALSFLAEASDLLAGQLDEDLVTSLTGQLIVPRLADWCAVWLEDETTGHRGWSDDTRAGGPRLARVWHASENRIEDLSHALEQNPPHPGDPLRPGPVPYPWPGAALDGPSTAADTPAGRPDGPGVEGADALAGESGVLAEGVLAGGPDVLAEGPGAPVRRPDVLPEGPGVSAEGPGAPVDGAGSGGPGGRDHGAAGEGAGVAGDGGDCGTALAYRLVAGGRPLGTLVIGRGGIDRFPDEVTGLVEDLGRRVALAIGAARQYARQATISAVLQRGLLPGAVAEIPGVRSALVYEPCDKGGPSGDFYDLFPAGRGRWCFAVGDVQGKGPEAAVVIGLARPWLRLLAREGYRVADVLDRLNQLLLDDATEAADAAARALVAAGARPTAPGDGPQTRFLSLLYGELMPFPGGVRCTLASAGHPLPLLLDPDGGVRPVAQPQTLLGVVEDAAYTSETFDMYSGDTLLCVTDGVTERRSGSRQFDDGDGLAMALASCAGMDAELIAERITQLVHEFGARPPADDLALLVLQAE